MVGKQYQNMQIGLNHRFTMSGQNTVNKQKRSTLYLFFCLNLKKLYLMKQEKNKSEVNIDQIFSEKSPLSNLTEILHVLPCFWAIIWNVCFDNGKKTIKPAK
jgi:hypothetical protein